MALLQSCTPDENPLPGNVDQVIDQLPVMLAETDYNAENTYYLLNDEESPDVFFDPAQRSFNVNNPLQFSMDDNHDLLLRFYSPRALRNVTIWARIEGYAEDFKLMCLEKVQPFQQLTYHIPFATKNLTAYTRSGKEIVIMANPHLTKENLTFTIESDDPYWQTLQSIKCGWRISFARYNGGYWNYKMPASHTREAVALSLNRPFSISTS